MNTPLKPLAADATFAPPADGFVHVQPYGSYRFTLPGGRKILLVIDQDAVDAQIADFRSRAAAAGPAFAGILCDYDHASCDQDKSTEAAAWAMDLQKRPDGLWAKMRWTDGGLAAVTGGRFRFTSNVHNPSDCIEIAPGKLRPLRVDRFALTNDPRMLQGAVRMKPISSRAVAAGDQTPGRSGQEGMTMDAIRNALIKILGLPDAATDEEILAAAEKFGAEEADEAAHQTEELKSRAVTAEGKLAIAIAEGEQLLSRATAAEAALAGMKADATLATLEGEGYTFTSRDEVKKRLAADHDNTVAFVRLQPPPAAKPGEALRSRAGAKTPDAAQLTPEQKKAERERLIDDAQRNLKLKSRASAVARVQVEHPELWT